MTLRKRAGYVKYYRQSWYSQLRTWAARLNQPVAFRLCRVDARYEWDVSFVVSVNIKRRQLDPSQLTCVAVELEAMFAVEAKKRMLKGVRDPRVNSPQGDHGKARDLAADVVSVSPRMVEYAKTIKRDTPLSFQCSPRASCIFPNWEFCISRLTTLCTTPNRSPISSCVQPS